MKTTFSETIDRTEPDIMAEAKDAKLEAEETEFDTFLKVPIEIRKQILALLFKEWKQYLMIAANHKLSATQIDRVETFRVTLEDLGIDCGGG